MVIEFTVTQISLDYLTYFIKWREPNWSEKPNWPWCFGGQLSPSRVVLDYFSQKRVGQVLFRPLQNLNRPKQILLWNFFSQFGPSESQEGFINLAPTRCNAANDWLSAQNCQGQMEVPSRLERHKDVGIGECERVHR